MNLSMHRYGDFIKITRGITRVLLLVCVGLSVWTHDLTSAQFYMVVLIYLELSPPRESA